MSNGSGGTTVGIALDDLKADKLRDVAYSANVDTTGATKKDDLVDRLREEGVTFGADGWTRNSEAFDVEERPKGSAPSDTTLLYGFTREATPESLVEAIEGLADERGLEVEQGTTESGKDTLTIIRPAEAQADEQGGEETAEFTCSGETADGDPCTREVEEPDSYCYQHTPDE